MDERLFWVSLNYATFGLVVINGRITEAPPIARWATGKSINYVLQYFRNKGAKVLEIEHG